METSFETESGKGLGRSVFPKCILYKTAQNSYIECFNHTYREDVLDAYLFDDLEEIHTTTERWLEDYNTIRPHEALQGLPPRQFAQQHA